MIGDPTHPIALRTSIAGDRSEVREELWKQSFF